MDKYAIWGFILSSNDMPGFKYSSKGVVMNWSKILDFVMASTVIFVIVFSLIVKEYDVVFYYGFVVLSIAAVHDLVNERLLKHSIKLNSELFNEYKDVSIENSALKLLIEKLNNYENLENKEETGLQH